MMSDGCSLPPVTHPLEPYSIGLPCHTTPIFPTICARPSKHAINCPKIMFYTTCRKLRNSREVRQRGVAKEGSPGVVATAALQLTAIIAAKIVLFALLLPLLLAVRSVCSKVSPARVYWHFKRYRKLTENYQKLDYRTMSICVCTNL